MWIETLVNNEPTIQEPVTPHAGVWIETFHVYQMLTCVYVTPHAGVWIETEVLLPGQTDWESLPMRECGLKLMVRVVYIAIVGHSPCGSVD